MRAYASIPARHNLAKELTLYVLHRKIHKVQSHVPFQPRPRKHLGILVTESSGLTRTSRDSASDLFSDVPTPLFIKCI